MGASEVPEVMSSPVPKMGGSGAASASITNGTPRSHSPEGLPNPACPHPPGSSLQAGLFWEWKAVFVYIQFSLVVAQWMRVLAPLMKVGYFCRARSAHGAVKGQEALQYNNLLPSSVVTTHLPPWIPFSKCP